MRIVSGFYKGRRIVPPKNIDLRPTTDMAKEALFNILNNIIDYEQILALDLFSGVGNISLELISRGCKSVTCVDSNSACLSFINKTAAELGINGINTVKADVFKFISKCSAKFDFVFADPPYENSITTNGLPSLIIDNGLLTENGIFVLEHPSNCNFEDNSHCFDHRTYSRVNFSFFNRLH